MSCDITSGFSLSCRDSAGGVKNVYILSGSITTIAEESEGLISGITGSGEFFKFELPRNVGDWTETPTPSLENGTVFYQEDVNIALHKLASGLRNQVKVLAQNPSLSIVVETNNGIDSPYTGRYFLLGRYRGMSLSAGSGATGTAFGDQNGYALTFSGQEPEPADEIKSTDGTLLSALSGIAQN
jgi:hypothetical protein